MRVIFSSGEAHRRRQYRVYGKAAERSTAEKSELDLDLHAGGKLEAHQSLNGLGVELVMSIRRLWVRRSNCSRESLYL